MTSLRFKIGTQRDFFNFELDASDVGNLTKSGISRIRDAKRRAMDMAGKAAVRALKQHTPQKYSKRLARSWTYRLYNTRNETQVRVVSPELNKGNRISGRRLLDILSGGTSRHVIAARNARALSVGDFGFFRRVQHPGTQPSDFLERAEEAALTAAFAQFNKSLRRFTSGNASE